MAISFKKILMAGVLSLSMQTLNPYVCIQASEASMDYPAFETPEVYVDPLQIRGTMLEAVKRAKSHITICSPFISHNSLRYTGLGNVLDNLIQNGVVVNVMTCSSLTRGKPYEVKGIQALQKMGACVKFYSDIHAKFILLDDQVALLGSFNFLSGSLNPKYRYYQLQLNSIMRGALFHEIEKHALAIARKDPAPVSEQLGGYQILSNSQQICEFQAELLKSARHSVEICSPHLSYDKIEFSGFLDLIRQKQNQGVNTIIYTDEGMDKSRSGELKDDAKKARDTLSEIVTDLVIKQTIHLKYMIIDGKSLYAGSDNFMAGSRHETGIGFWRDLGFYIENAPTQIAEIRKHMEATKTVASYGGTPVVEMKDAAASKAGPVLQAQQNIKQDSLQNPLVDAFDVSAMPVISRKIVSKDPSEMESMTAMRNTASDAAVDEVSSASSHDDSDVVSTSHAYEAEIARLKKALKKQKSHQHEQSAYGFAAAQMPMQMPFQHMPVQHMGGYAMPQMMPVSGYPPMFATHPVVSGAGSFAMPHNLYPMQPLHMPALQTSGGRPQAAMEKSHHFYDSSSEDSESDFGFHKAKRQRRKGGKK